MEPSLRSAAITDPSMRPILDWIDSYTSWEKLDEETRHDLATRAHAGDTAALEAMVNHNLRLVLSRACKRLGRGVPLADLVQEGWIGLRTAAGRFDPARKTRTTGQPVKFSSVATHWIDRALRNAIIEQGRTIRLPHHADEFLTRMRMRLVTGEPIRLDDQTQLDRLARDLTGNPHLRNVTLDYVEQVMHGPLSLDKSIPNENSMSGAHPESTLVDYIAAPARPDNSDLLDIQNLLLELVNNGTLSRREGWMICRHYGLDGDGGRTYSQMARELAEAATQHGKPKQAVSRQRIEQLMRPAMRKLRQYVLTHSGQLGDSTLAIVYSQEQRKGSQVPISPAKVKSTESPKTRSARRTSVNDSLDETTASRAAAPTPLRAHDSTKRRKRSSQHSQVPGVDVPYAEAI